MSEARGEPQNMRSIQSHSGVPEVYPQFFTLLEIPYEWKHHISHARSSNNYRSIVEGRLVAAGTSHRRKTSMLLLSVASIE